MSDTTAEEKSKPREPAKKGLHGWKAALAVFGCGTLAAFGFFGVIVGMLSMVINAASSGISATQSDSSDYQVVIPEQTIKPRDSMKTGSLDLCGGTIPQAENFSATRVDPGGSYNDPGEGEKPRVVVDECSWSVIPAGGIGSPWKLDFSYSSFVSDEEGGEASGEAEREYQERMSQLKELELESSTIGSAEVADESWYVHGLDASGFTIYAVVIQSGDTVYEMKFESNSNFSSGELIPISHFQNEQDALAEFIEVRLGIIGPG